MSTNKTQNSSRRFCTRGGHSARRRSHTHTARGADMTRVRSHTRGAVMTKVRSHTTTHTHSARRIHDPGQDPRTHSARRGHDTGQVLRAVQPRATHRSTSNVESDGLRPLAAAITSSRDHESVDDLQTYRRRAALRVLVNSRFARLQAHSTRNIDPDTRGPAGVFGGIAATCVTACLGA